MGKAKDKDGKVTKQFHEHVLELAYDTADVFKDNKKVARLVADGKWRKLFGFVYGAFGANFRVFDEDEILRAAERGHDGVASLAVDAAFFRKLDDLLAQWEMVMTVKEALPALTWPAGFKV